jgi:ureidoacrylate peracid hydrolase
MTHLTTREVDVEPAHTTLLFVDVQNFCARRDGSEFKDISPTEFDQRFGWFFQQMETRVVPNMQRLRAGCRAAGIEVMYTLIRNLTRDGRDRSLDYKITGFNVPKGSWDAQVVEEIVPQSDEIIIPKTSSSVFISTNIDYVLRNLDVRSLMIAGILTDQCVDSAVRDACDLGYLVTVISDACATLSQERHDWSLRNNQGYARQRTTAEIVAEIERLADGGRP